MSDLTDLKYDVSYAEFGPGCSGGKEWCGGAAHRKKLLPLQQVSPSLSVA